MASLTFGSPVHCLVSPFFCFAPRRDRQAAEPFLAGPSTNTNRASIIAARRGEALVYAYLQRQLQQELADKTAQVLWLNEEEEGGQSYDILIKVVTSCRQRQKETPRPER